MSIKPSILKKLEKDTEFHTKVAKIPKDYLKVGRDSLEYWSKDFDYCYDLMLGYAPLTRTDYERLERGDPRRFVLPMASTQISTMVTFLSSVLYGTEVPHKVEGRGPEDELPAEFMNQLLKWNAEQQPTYLLGYLWIQDALVTNRAVFYNTWCPVYETTVTYEEKTDEEAEANDKGEYPKYSITNRTQKEIGGYCRMDIVSPYDFFCDPAIPIWKAQEGRFMGHRVSIPFVELQKRSKLPPSNPQHIFPWALEILKEKKQTAGTAISPDMVTVGAPTGGIDANPRVSRTGYERGRTVSPMGNINADSKDTGNIECYEMWIKIIPKDYGLGTSEDATLYQFFVAQGDIILYICESPYEHGMFPYVVAEGRPFAHFQFSPSWVMMLKGIQDYVDWLKNRHQEALARTVGNVFVVDPTRVDTDDFLNPEKEGVVIPLKQAAAGTPISECFQQIPIKDLTENFNEEMMQFAQFSESVTGANSAMQGGSQGTGSDSATEYASTQQMASGRLQSIARNLSVQGLIPQTKMFVSMFQQYLTEEQIVRYSSDGVNELPAFRGAQSVKVNKENIQGSFDYIAQDMSLPGTDAKKVAAITRVLEAGAGFPDVFMPAPGNLDPRMLIYGAAKASGLKVDNFKYDSRNLPQAPGAAAPGAPAPGPAGAVPGPAPAVPPTPSLPELTIPPVAPSEPRPESI